MGFRYPPIYTSLQLAHVHISPPGCGAHAHASREIGARALRILVEICVCGHVGEMCKSASREIGRLYTSEHVKEKHVKVKCVGLVWFEHVKVKPVHPARLPLAPLLDLD